MLDVDRRQVLAYRVAAHGLDRTTAAPDGLDVLDLGVQESRADSARLALAARLPDTVEGDPVTDAERFTLAWTFRGAPHLHRRADLPALSGALWPRSDADAMARLAPERKPLKDAGISGLTAFSAAAKAMRAVVRRPLPKGEVSHGVTVRLPAAYSYDCRSCQATHVYGGLFQLVGLPAGLRLEPDTSPVVIAPFEDRPPVPAKSTGAGPVVAAYLRLHGPAIVADAAGYVGTSAPELRPVWPAGLAEVRVDGRKAFLPEDRIDLLRKAERPRFVRLLPPYDPFLQSRDRNLLVPDRERQKALWRIIGNPGALLVDGDVAGTWRAKTAGKRRADISVAPFGRLTAAHRKAIDEEAGRVATVRGATDVRVTYA